MLKWTSIPSKTALAVLALTLAGGTASLLQADRGGRGKSTTTSGGGGNQAETRLRAKSVTAITSLDQASTLQAELNGDARVRGTRSKFKAELENVNRNVGDPISFCLDGNAVGFATVQLEIVNVAEFEADSQDGVTPPTAQVGSILEAHDGGAAGAPSCAGTLLATATFKAKN